MELQQLGQRPTTEVSNDGRVSNDGDRGGDDDNDGDGIDRRRRELQYDGDGILDLRPWTSDRRRTDEDERTLDEDERTNGPLIEDERRPLIYERR